MAVHRGPRLRRDAQPLDASSTPRRAPPAARRRPSRPASSPPRSAPTAPARFASPPPGPTWSASSRSAGASPPGRILSAFNGLTVHRPAGAHGRGRGAAARRAQPATVPEDLHRPPAPAETVRRRPRGRDPGKLRIALSFAIPWRLAPARLDPRCARRSSGSPRCWRAWGTGRSRRSLLRPRHRRQLHAPLDARRGGVGATARADRVAARPAHPPQRCWSAACSPRCTGPPAPTRGSCAAASGGSSAASTSS